ncbi:SCO family protein [Gammaproteobacteria bacterium]|jgi:protein SCO1|nr:SCO family protein [Pseudomonadota bacterium]MDC1285042.1 SCO family protein [Gammaproteobacteria bacterium]
MQNSKNIVIALLVLSIPLVLGIYFANKSDPAASPELINASYLLNQQVAIADFNLIDQNEQPFTPEQVKGEWTFWFFGFTHCPDICPFTMGTLSAVMQTLKQEHDIDNVRTVFVSVDPLRDTPERMKSYLETFGPEVIGVSSAGPELATFIKNMGIVAKLPETIDVNDNYDVMHSSSIYLIAPNNAIAALLRTPHSVDDIVYNFQQVHSNYSK